MKLITNIEEAQRLIDSFQGKTEEFKLPISDQLQDSIGMNMAIITDNILKKGWMPDGFEQIDGCRIYKYISAD